MYLCYDLKGIQQYIFQIPKLKCCIGGSRQIDDFDRNFAKNVSPQEYIYSGGGKGSFICADQQRVDDLKKMLLEEARKKGLTIRFGFDEDYTRAAREIKETYSYQPDNLEGHPCRLSGLYPTTKEYHPLIQERLNKGGEKGMESSVEKKFLEDLRKEFGNEELHFFYDVNARDLGTGDYGAASLGNRNRWAVVCMDGNDMGKQFLAYTEQKHDESEWRDWLKKMSVALDECTCHAALQGMKAVTESFIKQNCIGRLDNTLPLRPLIVGGDDVTVLVGCDYAQLFVETVMEAFHEKSKASHDLWVGTGGELTISGGILYAPVSLPLHSALKYAESLLGSAKTKGREPADSRKVSPAYLDWESVTEGLLDSPGERRQRELRFIDEETGNTVELTERPYSLAELKKLAELKNTLSDLPKGLQHDLHPALYAPLAERLAFYARVGKNHRDLESLLSEPVPGVGGEYGQGWKLEGKRQTTRVLDALLLLQEERRMMKQTVKGEE